MQIQSEPVIPKSHTNFAGKFDGNQSLQKDSQKCLQTQVWKWN